MTNTPNISNDAALDGDAFLDLLGLALLDGADPTHAEVRMAEELFATKGAAAAATFLEHCHPGASISRDIENLELERDRQRERNQ